MNKIIVFAGSNSINSINKKFAKLAADHLNEEPYTVLDLNDFPLPMYSIDTEKEDGFPGSVKEFKQKIKESTGIILALAEHNGSYTAVFKNLMDWLSRLDPKFWEHKPMLLLSTSPGQRGGQFVMEAALSRFPVLGSNIVEHFSLPSFNDNYAQDKLLDEVLYREFSEKVRRFENAVKI